MFSEYLGNSTLDALHEAGLTDAEINRMSNFDLLDKWLTYQGIIGFTRKIMSITVDLIDTREMMK